MMKNSIAFTLLLIGVALGAFFFGTNTGVGQAQLALERDHSMERALRGVEESIFGASNALFYDMVRPSKTSMQEYKHHIAKINDHMTTYKNLLETDKEKAVAHRFDANWKQVVSKSDALLQARDEFQNTHEKAWDAVHAADEIVDYKLQPAFVPGSPDLLKKEKAIRELEVSLWEAINATNYYIYRPFDKPKREYPHQLDDVKEFWGTYIKLEHTSAEKPHVAQFEAQWKKAVHLMNKLFQDADKLAEAQSAYWDAVHKTESIIDFEVQPRALQSIRK